jgi:hypothetical protein
LYGIDSSEFSQPDAQSLSPRRTDLPKLSEPLDYRLGLRRTRLFADLLDTTDNPTLLSTGRIGFPVGLQDKDAFQIPERTMISLRDRDGTQIV